MDTHSVDDLPFHLRWYLKPLFRAVPELVEAWEDPLAEWARETGPLFRREHRLHFFVGFFGAVAIGLAPHLPEILAVVNTVGCTTILASLLFLAIAGPTLAKLWRRRRAQMTRCSFISPGNYAFFRALISGTPAARQPWIVIPLHGRRAANLIVAENILESGLWQGLCLTAGFLLFAIPASLLAGPAWYDFSAGGPVILIMWLTNAHWRPSHLEALSTSAAYLKDLSSDPLKPFNPILYTYNMEADVERLIKATSRFILVAALVLSALVTAFFIALGAHPKTSLVLGALFLSVIPWLNSCHS